MAKNLAFRETLGNGPAGTTGSVSDHASAALAEADRLMTVCNSCRYCEGLCAVFPAMEMRRSFLDSDLNYLANLCHSCGACYYDCQFSPPHVYDVNVPATFELVRQQSYAHYAWPRPFGVFFERNGIVTALVLAFSLAAFLLGFVAWHDPAVLFRSHQNSGSFYRLMPHNVMVVIFSAAMVFSVVALTMGAVRFWRDSDKTYPVSKRHYDVWTAIKDAAMLRYLDGGDAGCMNENEQPDDRRRLYHHLTFYGFMLCFASTSVATVYHYGLNLHAPYTVTQLPKLLGIAGGLGLIIGPIGLLSQKMRRDPALLAPSSSQMDVAFILMLWLTAATGFALYFLRQTPAMGITLALHLGVVFALFITMPYGKFVHGIYRFLALVRSAQERRNAAGEN
jgi:citrate/tricarballylate utilization protein